MSTYGVWLSASGMKVQEHRQALLANNMANVQTTGFKHDLAVVMQRRVESEASARGMPFAHEVLDGMPGGLDIRPTYQSLVQGGIEPTHRPLDVAIDGEGFFAVSDGSVTRYTRDGEFTRNRAGELVLKAGEGRWRVLDRAGAPIRIDEELGEPRASLDGAIRQGKEVIGRLELLTTEDKQSLRKVGENLFKVGEGVEMVPADGRFEPGSRERSTFDAMSGLAEMIESSRGYEINAKLLEIQDSLTEQAVSTVGRVR